MTKRELIKKLISGEDVPRCGFWMGMPEAETLENYRKETGLSDAVEIGRMLGDDIRWITPQYVPGTYRHPGKNSMRPWKAMNPHGMAGGPLSGATTVEDLDRIEWPEARYLDFSETIEILEQAGDCYRLSGFWSPFFHDLTYLLGTEELLIKMYTDPGLIHEILNRLCGFYYEANELFISEAGDLFDGIFFGNDFGTQNDLLVTPDQFETFFLPRIREFSGQAHRHGYHSVLHCCGSIWRIIDRLIDAGVDCLHPIQAKAYKMDAGSLAESFKGRIAFMGGIDTQHILPEGTPQEVRAETQRVMELLGPNIIIGPSHEVLMPNVPFENVKAMSDAVYNR